mgnify:CR=1 FL=1
MSCIDESFLLSSAALSVIVFTKYSNKAIDVFVSKLNEEYPDVDITRDKLFNFNQMKSFDEAKDLFMEMNPNVSDKTFRDELYEKYNAFQHTFIPAQMARTFGKDITIEMGIQKEIFNWNSEKSNYTKNISENDPIYNTKLISFYQDTYKDLHNNDVGAFYGEKIAKGELTLDQVADILFQGAISETRSNEPNAVIADRNWVTEEEYNKISIEKLYTSSQLYNDYNSNRETDMPPFTAKGIQTKYNGYRCKFTGGLTASPTGHDPIVFDLNGDGVAEKLAWAKDGDGVLVADLNGNGKIDNGSELLTAETLASFDTNEDGIIDENDTNFANLKILKSDGTLMTLTEAGITSINLNTTSTEITDKNGNQQFASGIFTRADGTTGTFGEFLVKTETSKSIATEWLEETDVIAELPDISGSGNIYSLHQAMRHVA